MDEWISTEQAAVYLGIGKTKLYALTREQRIPAKRVGKKWLYERDALAAWVRSSRPLESYFVDTVANIEANTNLRDPQRDAYARALEFFQNGGMKAIIQLPVGCGKSGVAAILPFGIANGRVLVIAPSLPIKDELMKSLDITNRQKCFWRRMRVLEDNDMASGPFVCTLDSGNMSVCEKSHIVLTNIQQLAANVDKWLTRFPQDFFDMIIVDEAHHGAASSWKRVFEQFPKAKVVNLTATPFRSDRQELEGELIFRYPFKSASIKGYIKKIKASYVAPTELNFTVAGEQKTFSLDEVLAMKEEEWFSRGVALSDPCNVSVVDNSLEKLEMLRQTGTKHQLIGVACSINHAQRIRSLYKERGFDAAMIHSKQDAEEQESVMRDLRNGVLDCIIQVQMLGEGFDHPKLSVAAIFRPFRSLAPYIQFVGRILRVVVQNDATHPDNYGHIVTHIGLNLDEQLRKFKQFENDDQKFWEEVTGGKEPDPPHEVLSGETRLKLHEDMIVNSEIVDRLFEEDFSSAEDADILQDLEKKLESLGLDPALARQVLEGSRSQKTGAIVAPAAQPFSVIPAKRWQESRRRLDEEAKRTAKLVLNRTGLTPQGVELPYKLKPGIGAKNNFIAAFQMVNEGIAKRVAQGRKRQEWTTEEFATGIAVLPEILDGLVREVKKLQDVKG